MRWLLPAVLVFLLAGSVAALSPVHTDAFGTACTTPASLTASPPNVLSGAVTKVRFKCGSSYAFNATAGTNTTPVFILPSGALSLWVVSSDSFDVGRCQDYGSAQQLATASFVNFTSNSTWDYCLQLNQPTGSFLIVWGGVLLLQSFPAIGSCSGSGISTASLLLTGLFVAIFFGVLVVFLLLTGKGGTTFGGGSENTGAYILFFVIITVIIVVGTLLVPTVLNSLNQVCS